MTVQASGADPDGGREPYREALRTVESRLLSTRSAVERALKQLEKRQESTCWETPLGLGAAGEDGGSGDGPPPYTAKRARVAIHCRTPTIQIWGNIQKYARRRGDK